MINLFHSLLKKNTCFFTVLIVTLWLSGCGAEEAEVSSGAPDAGSEEMHVHTDEHAQQLYVCPMHPQIVRDEVGSCPICGMDLVAKRVEPKQSFVASEMLEHSSEIAQPRYVCPMHPQIVRDEASSCPVCGMDLVAKKVVPQDSLEVSEIREHSSGHGHQHFVCPMHPQIVRDEAGSCPVCGMNLVKKVSADSADDRPAVVLDAAVVQNMGVRTIAVKRASLSRKIQTQGTITYDEDYIIQLHARTAGWIETLNVRTSGETVKRKDELAQFFSPYIMDVQRQYLTALEDADTAALEGKGLEEANIRVKSLDNSLRLLNMMDMDIKRLEKYRKIQNTLPIMAPQGGVITELGVREGMYVEPEDPLFTIVDIGHLWVMVDIYEHQAGWVKPGLEVTIHAPALPERTWTGTLEFVYPEVDPMARTLRARIAVNNPDGALLPNMFVEVAISSLPRKNVLVLPRQAVILTGEREAVVKSLGNGRFQPVDVSSGLWVGEDVEIISGLQEGDQVVVSGQFMIDSESSLQAAFSRLSE